MSGISSKSENAQKERRPKKLKKINSTNTILWRYFALFVFGVIAVIALVCYGILGNAGLSRTRKRIRSVGGEFAAVFEDESAPPPEVVDKLTNYALMEGIDVFLFDESGHVKVTGISVQNDTVAMLYGELHSKLPEWRDGATVEYTTRKNGKAAMNFAECVTYRGESCKLLVRAPISPVADTVRHLEIYVLIVTLGALVIAFFVSYSLAKKLSTPLSNISKTAKKLAGGDYSVQFNSAEYAEIAMLSDSLNYMKDEIKKSGDFQKEILANVSHDLKTPLTMIKAYASMIQEISGDDPEKRNKHLQVIIDESDRLTGLVNDILSTSKISSGIEQLNKKVFNLTELLYGVINKFSYLQETQGYSLMVDVEPNLYTLADEEKIYQVIYNLVSNAVNYTGADKTVYISLRYSPAESRIKFAVRDTGAGIAEEEMEHIWERYYRSKDTHTRPVKGTGLGLNIVKIILQGHAFEFGVNSKVGEGSTFFVDFPAVPATPEEEE